MNRISLKYALLNNCNIFIICIIFLLQLSSCKKKEPILDTQDKMYLLTNNNSKTWLLKNITSLGVSVIADCGRDDLYTFDKNSSLVTYTPNNTCYSNDTTTKLPFEISQNLPWLTIDGFVYVIDEISNSKLVISHDGKDEGSRINAENQILHQQQTLTLIANN